MIMNFIFIFLTLFIHDFHVSKCLVEYNENTKSLEISLHLFIDDFEDALKTIGAEKLFLCTDRESPIAEEWIEKYLKRKLKIELNGQPVLFKYLGKEPASDYMAVWCYMEVTDVENFSSIDITNELLLEIFSDQKNIISILGPGKKKEMMLFQKGSIKQSVTF